MRRGKEEVCDLSYDLEQLGYAPCVGIGELKGVGYNFRQNIHIRTAKGKHRKNETKIRDACGGSA